MRPLNNNHITGHQPKRHRSNSGKKTGMSLKIPDSRHAEAHSSKKKARSSPLRAFTQWPFEALLMDEV
jgi:ribosomal protein L14E/L6E/L27E